jgi:hypothetical protein
VPQPKKASDDSRLPQRELNPLLNPLLAANMGRWAEVYFTSAPERREQAVADLLRELESNSPSEISSPQQASGQRSFFEEVDRGDHNVNHDENEAPGDHSDKTPWGSPPESLPVLHCSACEAVNWLGQRFCGMCGAPLPVPEDRAPDPEEELPVATTSWTEHGLSHREELVEQASAPEVSQPIEVSPTFYDVSDTGDEAPEPAWHGANDLPAFARAPEAVPYRYRAYIGIILSILLVGLVYLAWRHGMSGTGSGTQSAAIPAMPAEQPTSPSSVEPVAKQSAPPAAAPNAPAAPAPPAAQAPRPQAKPPKPHAVAPRKATPVAPLPARASNTSAEQSGNAELLVAQKFLKGGPGTTRDSKEASTWLWKAVSKQNLTAALLLSDLYLRGDGVPKSCDQARLLLNAAARKGEATAAERLGNLQSFGCQ